MVQRGHDGLLQDSPGAPCLLVADDEPIVRRLLELALTREGFTVWSAANGREALDLYGRHRDCIHLVLLDVQMPVLDGPQTLAELRRLDPKVCVLLVSGHIGAYEPAALLALGAAGLLPKPFDLEGLVRMVRGLLDCTGSRGLGNR